MHLESRLEFPIPKGCSQVLILNGLPDDGDPFHFRYKGIPGYPYREAGESILVTKLYRHFGYFAIQVVVLNIPARTR
jgi:hypothetical protein